MGLKKGQTNNRAGRPRGQPNKITTDLRGWVNSFIQGQTAQIEKDWKRLEPQQRIILFERLLKYSLPTLQSTTLTTDIDKLTSEQVNEIFNTLIPNSHELDRRSKKSDSKGHTGR
jgi:hypothetical protein